MGQETITVTEHLFPPHPSITFSSISVSASITQYLYIYSNQITSHITGS